MPSRIFLASALFGVIPFVLGFYFLAHARSFTALLGAPWPATARLGERPFRAYTSALGVRDFGLGVAHLSLALTGDAYGTALSFAGAIIFLLVGDFLVLSGYVVPHAYSTLSKTAIGLLHLPFTPIFAYAIARLVRRPRPPVTLTGPLRYLAGLTAFISLYFGIQFILSPSDTAIAFGVPLPTLSSHSTTTYLAMCGTRDLTAGLINLGCVFLGNRRGAGVMQVAAALRAAGDAWVVARYGSKAMNAALVHLVVGGLTGALALATLGGSASEQRRKVA